jgi:biotin transport system substrate-specific component
MIPAAGSATFVDALASRTDSSSLIRVGAVLFVTALTAAAAQISIPLPFTQVPFTFQPMVVLLGGLALGSRLAAASQVLYLLAGIAGLPPGALRLLGPTGGYLMAYPFAAFLTGYLAERGLDRRYLTSVLAMLAGLIVVYAFGATWLGVFARTGSSAPIGLHAALVTGVYPFIAADVLKLLAAAGILPGFWWLSGRTDRR